MRSITTGLRRLGLAASMTAALTLAGASTASAHHCYKDTWSAAAHSQQSSNKSPWMTLSDLGVQFIIIGELNAPECAGVADDVVADLMRDKGLVQEPLIHTKATVGGGAFYHKGKAPGPFEYLSEADFEFLTVGVIEGVAKCQAGHGV